ncbi:cytochrome P450 [Aromatoleum toluclasticum]|uniref:cytochrome P450 n=1 Tax=Aromatoleum toluclasticum TaxID=92003 RepID=UPI001D1962EB|nr:cytochrome P450 [Aromatoleum toluclasticum]MCC4113938.1 cytochrome P450 [Aromatoleum toluclasticum]
MHTIDDLLVDGQFLQDPYPAYQALRERGSVHWSEEFFQGAWLLTDHADVERVLRDPRFSAARTGGWVKRIDGIDPRDGDPRGYAEFRTFQRLFARAMIFVDGPDHGRLRQVLAAGFHPQVIRGFSTTIERLVVELLDTLDGRDFDFIEAFARPLPSRVIALLMGIDLADEKDFIAWSDDLVAFIGAPKPSVEQVRAAEHSLVALIHYFQALLPARRKMPRDDLVSRLVIAEAEGKIRTDAELLVQCAMLLLAGHETTRNLLGNGLHALLSHPSEWARLREQPDLMPSALREALRYSSPVQYTGRRVVSDLQLHGHTLRRGDLVIALIGAANRDPTRYTQPDVFDISRHEGSHLAFGSGPHVCIGAGLSLLEAELAFSHLMRYWPTMHASIEQARWNGNAAFRGLATLPVHRHL